MFFTAVAVTYGPPDLEAKNYVSGKVDWKGGPERGLSAYMRDTVQGQLFTRMVIEAGEAKSRVNQLYWRYCRWVREHERLATRKSHTNGEKSC